MALKINKWIPDTYLRAINYGNGIIEFSAHVTANPERTGKTFVINANSELFIQVKELVPVEAEELSRMTADDLSFNVSNKGTEDSKFNILDEGPYRSEVNARKYQNDMQRVIDYYQEAKNKQDFYTMKQLLNKPVPDNWKVNPLFYSGVNYLRGQMFRSFMRLPEAEAAFEQGWEGFPENDKWIYCFEWASTLLSYLINAQATTGQKGKALQKAIEVLNRISTLVEGMKYQKYHRMAAACVRAFMLCYLDEAEQALAEFDEFDFTPLSSEEYKEIELDMFFRFVAYGFWAALDMKNAELLRSLSSIISTGFPDMLREPSPVRCFRRAFGNASEKGRTQLSAEVEVLTRFAHYYAPELSNLRQFVIHLNNKDDLEVDGFIPFVDWNNE